MRCVLADEGDDPPATLTLTASAIWWNRSRIEEMAPILPPDHEPIPSGVEDLNDAAPKVGRAGVVLITLYQPPLPLVQPHPVVQAIKQPRQADDPPSEDYSSPVSYSLDRGVQTTSGAMPFNQHDWPIPPRRPSNAHLTMSSTNAALLFASTSSGDMPFNNHDWPPVPRRQTLHSSQMMFSTSDALLFGNSTAR